jgi:hypothetical protein
MRRRWSVAGLAAGAHLLLLCVFLVATKGAIGGEERMLWALWLPIDFPASLLVGWGFENLPVAPSSFVRLRTWWPHLVHGLIGTAWWFCLGFAAAALFDWLRQHKRVDVHSCEP